MRRAWITTSVGLVAVACALATAAVTARPSPAAAHPRLNVVLIVSDDERYDAHPRMAAVNRLLARHGVTFSSYYDVTSECCPARAGLLTGQDPQHTGVVTNFGPHGYGAFREGSTLATWLHAAGYDTGLVGKYLNGYTTSGDHHVPPGWDSWVAVDSIPEERYYHYVLNENGHLVHYGSAPKDYSTTVFGRHAVRFVQTAHEPFFLYLAPVAPHLPAWAAPRDRGTYRHLTPLRRPSFDERDISDKPWRLWHPFPLTIGQADYKADNQRRRMLEAMLELDRVVGRVVDALHRRGVLGRTLIVYLSDNGFLWGEHRLGGKIWPYEESIHLPLVIRTPWRAGDGRVDAHRALPVDIAPTIADLAGVRPATPVDGWSLAPFLHGAVRVPWRTDSLVEYLGPSQLRVGGPPPFIGVRTDRFLYVAYRNGWRELYDLKRDPWELRNVAGTGRYASTEAWLARRATALAEKPPHPPA